MNSIAKSCILNFKIRPLVTEVRIRIKRVGGTPPKSLILNAYLVMSGLIVIIIAMIV